MSVETSDLVIGLAFVVVFAMYGVAVRQRLLAYRDAMQAAWAELERRQASGLATADAQRSYDDAAEAMNELLERFPSNVAGRMLNIQKVPVADREDPDSVG